MAETKALTDINLALALEAWSIIFTFAANTAFYFESAAYLKTIDKSSLTTINDALFGMDWL